MPYCADLTVGSPWVVGANVRAVGWLSVSHPFAVGPVSKEFVLDSRRLREDGVVLDRR